ncbi:hypothetical protein EVAR_70160_1 [Eumeta japonica]|uniref:Uncharacterized protein n=1 Tax=Eumeta variegata TaxID=151549 RepID=A0A4C1SCJ0_EUMVA|nr:hypothetical protein EVAR_70160_1 [Eumeta japonica]
MSSEISPTGSVRSIALRGVRPFSLDTPYIKEKQYKPMFRHTTRKLVILFFRYHLLYSTKPHFFPQSATPEPDDMPRILPTNLVTCCSPCENIYM